ncbi:hypothetical protein JTB14_030501 [Gonioctena quinquepunctata]|nr:hypothetical protein JTB14_030501 [Gonioctena quinquepunctata]
MQNAKNEALIQNELEVALYESDISLSDTEDPQYIQPNLRNDHNGASSDLDPSESEPIERDRPVSEISLSSSLMHRSTRSTRVSRRRRGHHAPTRVRNTSFRSNGTSAQLVNNEWTAAYVARRSSLNSPAASLSSSSKSEAKRSTPSSASSLICGGADGLGTCIEWTGLDCYRVPSGDDKRLSNELKCFKRTSMDSLNSTTFPLRILWLKYRLRLDRIGPYFHSVLFLLPR